MRIGAFRSASTYLHKGKQYIVVPVGDRHHKSEFVALGIPDATPATGGGAGTSR